MTGDEDPELQALLDKIAATSRAIELGKIIDSIILDELWRYDHEQHRD